MTENKSWFKRHLVWTVIIVLVIIGFIGSLFSPSETSTEKKSTEPSFNAIDVVKEKVPSDMKDKVWYSKEWTQEKISNNEWKVTVSDAIWKVSTDKMFCSQTGNLVSICSDNGIAKTYSNVEDYCKPLSLCQQDETKTTETSREATFSKSINDPKEDCISAQNSNSITCNKAVDIISADIDQKNGVATIDIELLGDVPSKNELKVGELGAETYQYQVWTEINGKWSNVLFGDVTDTLGVSGGCGFSATSCSDSQVDFTISGNKVKIVGPLKSEITKFRIKTLYQSGSLEEDDIIDEAESN